MTPTTPPTPGEVSGSASAQRARPDSPQQATRHTPHAILRFFRPAPPAPVLATDPAAIRAGYAHWQPRILFASTVGYAVFYFVRVNLPVAMPAIEKDLHLTKTDLGLFLTLHGLVYGLSKFFNGFLGDRANAPRFMATGLLLSALANFAFGSSSLAISLGLFWVLNGYVQGMGFPPCARLLTHWFPPRQLATKMSIWNISHQVGGFLVLLLTGQLVVHLGWRSCFYVPAVIALATSLYLFFFLRDTPESLGLPPVESLDDTPNPSAAGVSPASPPSSILHPLSSPSSPLPPDAAAAATAEPLDAPILDYERTTHTPDEDLPYRRILVRYVFSNPYIWLVSIANFFVYTIRYAVVSWSPTFLSQQRHIQLTHAAAINASFEFMGLFGALSAGYITDRFFAGRSARVALFYMIACTGLLYLFYKLPAASEVPCAIMIALLGFTVYGPQCLIGIAAANLATKRAAAASVGLTGLFGYASTLLSGYGVGYVADHYGWNAVFRTLMFVCLAGVLLFIACWPAKAHRNA